MTGRTLLRAGVLVAAACAAVACAARMRVDEARMSPIQTIAPISFVGNKSVSPPGGYGELSSPSDPSISGAAAIFQQGIPAFVGALERTERFTIVPPERVLEADAYGRFPKLVGTNAGNAQLAAGGWRFVEPTDGEPITALLEELGADAALITYWFFSLDHNTRGGIGVDTATPRVRLRAWLVDRDGKVIADDEIEVLSDQIIGIVRGRYDGRALTPLFTDSIETAAVRLIADLSNARARGQERTETP